MSMGGGETVWQATSGCRAFRESASARLDGALDECEAAALAAHLAVCPSCRAHSDRLRQARTALGSLEASTPVSSRLRARLEAEAGAVANREAARRRVLRLVGACSAAILAGLTLAGISFWHTHDLTAILLADHLKMQSEQDVLQVASAKPAAVERWLADRLDYDARVPELPGARLLGGRTCTIQGKRVALIFYDGGGTRVSLFALPRSARWAPLRPAEFTGWKGGVQLYSRADAGIRYAAVAEIPGPSLKAMVLAGLSPGRTGTP